MIAIAIDLGGTNIKIGLVDDGNLMVEDEVKAHSAGGLNHSLPKIKSVIDKQIEKTKLMPGQVKGVGMGFPGLVDNKSMIVLSTNQKYEDALQIDLKRWVIESFGVRLFLENDARIALLGEWQFGAGQGYSDLVMMTLGTGVGSAAIIEDQLLVGKHFQAGCLGGHFIINTNGTLCTCGNQGCVEAEASAWRLEDLLKSFPNYADSKIAGEKLDFENLFRFAAEGDELSKTARDECIEVWAAGVITLIHAYDPEIVILGGGVMRSAEVIVPHIT